MNAMKWVVLAIALAALPVEWASAQHMRDGYRLDKPGAEALEAALAKNPDDLAARTKLLGYYFRGAIRLETPEVRIAARRRHILWLIEHHPGSAVAGHAIDPTGHALADKDGYEQAAKLWMQQVQRHGSDAAVLGNAGNFFLMPDKVQAEALYQRAQQAAPHDQEWSGRLGTLYALSVLGLDIMNENGFPLSHSPVEAKGDFAKRAREELEKSTDPAMVIAAGALLSTRGFMMEAMFRGPGLQFAVDYAPLTETLLLRAQELAPNPHWAHMLDEFRRLRRELQQRIRELEQRK